MSDRDRAVPTTEISFRPIEVKENAFVGSNTCRACHPSHYDTWHDSYHRSMTQVASPETVATSFDGIDVPVHDRQPMHLERRGNELWAELDDPNWTRAGVPPRIRRQVVMTTGSHHYQVYWYRTDNSRVLGQLPAVYFIEEQRWVPRGSVFLSPNSGAWPSEEGRWNRVCVNCHSANAKPLATPPGWVPTEPQSADTRVSELGITCESCHGPAEEHVRLNRRPWRRYWLHMTGRPDPTIVQPQRLPPRLASQVCGQCHAVWDFYDEAAHKAANESGLPYRPGQELQATRFLAQPAQDLDSPRLRAILRANPRFLSDTFWADGMIRVGGRDYTGLISSPCYKEARDPTRTMTCFSCHRLHKTDDDPRTTKEWANYLVAEGRDGNEACLQCHTSMRGAVEAHTKHKAGSTGSACYNCHMPYTTYGLLKAIRSHQISSPDVRATLRTGRPNACNGCHLDRTLQWTSEHLGSWYGLPPVELSEEQRTVAASLLSLLRGDEGQRALAAWSMGWAPAQQVSGTSWMAPYLAVVLNDPYDAVRLIAFRSLRSLPGFATFDYDFMAPTDKRLNDRLRAMDLWRITRAPIRRDPALLLDAEGWPDGARVIALYNQRDDTLVSLSE